MKKLLVFVAVLSAFSFASCKKGYVCSCTTSYKSTGAYAGDPTKTDDTAEFRDSKKGAEDVCKRMSSDDADQTTECVVK